MVEVTNYNGHIRLRSSVTGTAMQCTVDEWRGFRADLADGKWAHIAADGVYDGLALAPGGVVDNKPHYVGEDDPSNVDFGPVTASDLRSVAIASGGGFKSRDINLPLDEDDDLKRITAIADARRDVIDRAQVWRAAVEGPAEATMRAAEELLIEAVDVLTRAEGKALDRA